MIGALRTRTAVDPAPALIALGCLALAFRSLAPVASIATASVGAIGMLAWGHGRASVSAARWLLVTASGSALFASAMLLGDARAPRVLAFGVFAVTLAAVAEEAFFRRFLHGWLEPHGVAVAIGVGALLFGLIHVPLYGWAILPLDIAAGIVLGWQRAVTGSWTAPAVTHVIANLVVFL